MIKGISPTYWQMDIPDVKTNGRYNSSYGTWSWNSNMFENEYLYNEEYLWGLYKELKNS